MGKRQWLPKELERSVKIEARHRCAVCEATPIEVAHIVPYEEVQEHTFGNLIALCPNCHTRFDNGEIDRKAMRQYKERLARRSIEPIPVMVEGEYDPSTAELLGGRGVTSITDVGTGDFVVNFATAHSDGKYGLLITPQSGRYEVIDRFATGFRVRLLTSTGGLVDTPFGFKIL